MEERALAPAHNKIQGRRQFLSPSMMYAVSHLVADCFFPHDFLYFPRQNSAPEH